MTKRKRALIKRLKAGHKKHIRCIETGETFVNYPELIRRANLDIKHTTLRWRFHEYGKYVGPNGYTYIREYPKPQDQTIFERAYKDINLPTSGWLRATKLIKPKF